MSTVIAMTLNMIPEKKYDLGFRVLSKVKFKFHINQNQLAIMSTGMAMTLKMMSEKRLENFGFLVVEFSVFYAISKLSLNWGHLVSLYVKFCWFFVQTMASKSPFEINWSLRRLKKSAESKT